MTLAVAWVRRVATVEELVVTSDSRLRFGKAWDCCPKVFTLPRSDAVLCFAHNTAYAYPIVQQLRTAIELYERARSRAMDLGAVRGHLERVMNGMLPFLHDAPKGMSAEDDLDTVFMLAGYSWLTGKFRIWTLYYDRNGKRFRYAGATRWAGDKYFMFAGDEIPTAKRRLHELLRKRGKGANDGLDMEPFEVLRDMIRDPDLPTIGGPPQVLKVYKHMNVMPYAVAWPSRNGRTTLLGRELLDYEKTSFLILDPDSLDTFETSVSSLVASRS